MTAPLPNPHTPTNSVTVRGTDLPKVTAGQEQKPPCRGEGRSRTTSVLSTAPYCLPKTPPPPTETHSQNTQPAWGARPNRALVTLMADSGLGNHSSD